MCSILNQHISSWPNISFPFLCRVLLAATGLYKLMSSYSAPGMCDENDNSTNKSTKKCVYEYQQVCIRETPTFHIQLQCIVIKLALQYTVQLKIFNWSNFSCFLALLSWMKVYPIMFFVPHS